MPAPLQEQSPSPDHDQHHQELEGQDIQQGLEQDQQQLSSSSIIEQLSIFSMLPSELIMDIFSYLDVVTIFRFLDTCRYHRYLLLNLPEIWRRVRFMPISEYAALSSSSGTTTTLSAAAAAGSLSTSTALPDALSSRKYHRPPLARRITRISNDGPGSSTSSGSGSDSSSESPENPNPTTNVEAKAASRLRHSENDRDRGRGGSLSLISEIYAVLRRFRKENRLVDFVREIYMDSTDSPQFPSPLVMLVKFPFLQVLSSRYRRNQTSLTTDTHTLKDWLRSGDIISHSLQLRRWDVFHPYMTNEDITGFKSILDAIAIVGKNASGVNRTSLPKPPMGVALDIRSCPGPLDSPEGGSMATAGGGAETVVNGGQHLGGGIHWASATSSPVPIPATPTPTSTSPSPGPVQPCTNIVWVLEKCRMCNTHQELCYRCVPQCKACKAVRPPPSINHQMTLERERARQTSGPGAGAGSSSHASLSTASSLGYQAQDLEAAAIAALNGRPRTPPGSISLTQMSSPVQGVPSAYLHSQPSSVSAATSLYAPQPVMAALSLPPEFSFFD
ncbi:hypothetical protein BG011_000380 [Mortierella polycephala]|uniref:F-box domain-containing protein n=1 Tax=Mortierella polycephala TaxID=41804 RepID=A0A9P6TVV2_9FUNG|nr:hypothetical protein BG011_000380 [Mortierella polycephala]